METSTEIMNVIWSNLVSYQYIQVNRTAEKIGIKNVVLMSYNDNPSTSLKKDTD